MVWGIRIQGSALEVSDKSTLAAHVGLAVSSNESYCADAPTREKKLTPYWGQLHRSVQNLRSPVVHPILC